MDSCVDLAANEKEVDEKWKVKIDIQKMSISIALSKKVYLSIFKPKTYIFLLCQKELCFLNYP